MNKARLATIHGQHVRMVMLEQKLNECITEAKSLQSELEELKTEEEDYLENMPESLQSSDKAERAQTAIDQLDAIIGELGCVIDLDTRFSDLTDIE